MIGLLFLYPLINIAFSYRTIDSFRMNIEELITLLEIKTHVSRNFGLVNTQIVKSVEQQVYSSSDRDNLNSFFT
jgi:hypothetical protein